MSLVVDDLEPPFLSLSDVTMLRKDGFVVLRRYLDPRLLAAAAKEYEAAYARTRFDGEVPVDEPVAVLWSHTVGERKKTTPLASLPHIHDIVRHPRMIGAIRGVAPEEQIRLLETVVFNKPPRDGGILRWHQDASFFPLDPPKHYSMWAPFDVVDRANGAVQFARGSHNAGLKGSIDLHTGVACPGEDRLLVPRDPVDAGYEVVCAEVEPGDVILFDCLVWHSSFPNVTPDRQRRGLSVRYLIGSTRFRPRPGSAATFMKQISVPPGALLEGAAFPVLD